MTIEPNYRPRMMVLEAWQNGTEMPMPDWARRMEFGRRDGVIMFGTNTSMLQVALGDWLLRAPSGNVYACSRARFEECYERTSLT